MAADIASLEYPSGIALLISPQRARALAAHGMDKRAVEDFVWERAVMPASRFRTGTYWTTLIEPSNKCDGPTREHTTFAQVRVTDLNGELSVQRIAALAKMLPASSPHARRAA